MPHRTYHSENNHEALEEKSLKAINSLDPNYPQKLKSILGKSAPQNLYFQGNLELLNHASVGFCGSRKASDKGIETAADCAKQVAEKGICVISGYASGVDIQAHKGALEAGGSTIIILPEGIEHFRIKKVLSAVWDWDRILVLSQFKPTEPWKAFRAMARNKTIVALSKAMIVIEAGETGGTMEAGKASLGLKIPLFVINYENKESSAGNEVLLRNGGIALFRSRTQGNAKLNKLFDALESSIPVEIQQLNLI